MVRPMKVKAIVLYNRLGASTARIFKTTKDAQKYMRKNPGGTLIEAPFPPSLTFSQASLNAKR